MSDAVNRPAATGIDRRSLPAKVAANMHERILSGEYPPGSKFSRQRDLAISFGVSPTVMREALSRLIAAGVIRTKSGHGTFVTDQPVEAMRFPTWVQDPVSPTELSEAIEARDVLEHATAMRAAERRSVSDVKQLRRIIVRMVDAGDNITAFVESDIELHLAVAAAARNRILTGALSALQRSLRETVIFGVQDAIDNNWIPALVDSHSQLVEAIAEQDAHTAGAMMETMFGRLREIAEKSGLTVDAWPRP